MRVTKAVIPAAGFGTRFLPATKAQPKEMLTVVDKPVIQYIVEEAVAAGITDIIIITGQNKRAIEDHFDRNFELEVRLEESGKTRELKEMRSISKLANFVYVRQKEALGDGHAILEAASLLRGEPFAMMFGDDLVESNTPALLQLVRAWEEFQAPIIGVSAVPKKDVSRYGVVGGTKIRDNIYHVSELVEKPSPSRAPSNLVVAGRYIFSPEYLETLRKMPHRRGQEIRNADAMIRYIKKHPAYALHYEGTWHDCGSKLGLLKAQITYGLKHPEFSKDLTRFLNTNT